jgi:diketogulonate reductase-like aldo/keto reductase
VAVVAYSPFSHGPLPSPATAIGTALQTIAPERGCSRHQLALQFVSRFDGLFAIPKASTMAHVEDNAGANHWELSSLEIAQLEAALALYTDDHHLPML